MYTFSNRLKIFSIILMVLGAVGVGIGFMTSHKTFEQVEQLLAEDPTKMLKNVIPGKLGARDYDSAAFRAVEGLLRARSGAAIPESEVRRYMNANLPKIGDSKEEMKFKLEAFRKDLEDIALSSGSFDAATVLGM